MAKIEWRGERRLRRGPGVKNKGHWAGGEGAQATEGLEEDEVWERGSWGAMDEKLDSQDLEWWPQG